MFFENTAPRRFIPKQLDQLAERWGLVIVGPRLHRRSINEKIGDFQIGSHDGILFFQLFDACYKRCAVMTSNRSFGEWGKSFGDSAVAAALLNCPLNHTILVQMQRASYRLRGHPELLPDYPRTRSSSWNPAC